MHCWWPGGISVHEEEKNEPLISLRLKSGRKNPRRMHENVYARGKLLDWSKLFKFI